MNKIFFITFVAFSMTFTFSAYAQEGGRQGTDRRDRHFDREAFEAKRNAFITAELELTPEEAAQFIPLCDELRQKKFEAGNKCRRLSREVGRNKNVTKEEYSEVIDVCLEVGIKEAQLEKEYYEKFKKVLPPDKLYKYRDAEFKFARHYMRDQGNRGNNPRRENDKKEE